MGLPIPPAHCLFCSLMAEFRCRTIWDSWLTALFTKLPDCLPPYRTVSYSAIHKAAGLPAAVQNSLLQRYSQSRRTACRHTEQSLTALFTKPLDCLPPYRTVSYSTIHKATGLPATVQNGLLQRYSQSRWTACRHTERGLEVVLYGGSPLTFFRSAGNHQ